MTIGIWNAIERGIAEPTHAISCRLTMSFRDGVTQSVANWKKRRASYGVLERSCAAEDPETLLTGLEIVQIRHLEE